MRLACWAIALLLIAGGVEMIGVITAGPGRGPAASSASPGVASPGLARQGDRELAFLLVKLVLETRRTIAGHFTSSQSPVPGVDLVYRRWLTKNGLLPAAVAGSVFHEVVPAATGGRAWVKMVVDEPRNPKNRADATATRLLARLRSGAASADESLPEAHYYAEPIRGAGWCLACHGDPRGAPDPAFPQYKKEGWKADAVVGAVVARVAPPR